MAQDAIPARLLLGAYAEGIFPMACEGRIEWFSPQMRGVIPLDERFHVPHGLRRTLRRNPFEVRMDTAFSEVMRVCGAGRNVDRWDDPGQLRGIAPAWIRAFGGVLG